MLFIVIYLMFIKYFMVCSSADNNFYFVRLPEDLLRKNRRKIEENRRKIEEK